jgi:hypothetical protein
MYPKPGHSAILKRLRLIGHRYTIGQTQPARGKGASSGQVEIKKTMKKWLNHVPPRVLLLLVYFRDSPIYLWELEGKSMWRFEIGLIASSDHDRKPVRIR